MNSPIVGQRGIGKIGWFLSCNIDSLIKAEAPLRLRRRTNQTRRYKVTNPGHEFMTVRQIVEMTGLDRRTIYRHIEKGLLTPCNRREKRGRMLFFRRVDVMRYIDNLSQG
jgi:predicted DNA-binding transcriptional regulator AlpA